MRAKNRKLTLLGTSIYVITIPFAIEKLNPREIDRETAGLDKASTHKAK